MVAGVLGESFAASTRPRQSTRSSSPTYVKKVLRKGSLQLGLGAVRSVEEAGACVCVSECVCVGVYECVAAWKVLWRARSEAHQQYDRKPPARSSSHAPASRQ